ncbi:MAG: pimeloyl-ACP methyl ester carboxylesterase [Gammaproteobacteria bacterium]
MVSGALGLEQVCMMGCSKGGMIGQILATRYPQRLRALVLASTAAYAGGPDAWEPRIEEAVWQPYYKPSSSAG